MIALKLGVHLWDLSPQMVLAALVVSEAYRAHAVDLCVITSANDGTHGPTTLHHKGQALDFRIHNVPQASRPAVVEAIKRALLSGEGQYEVYWEAVGTEQEHLHVEWDPK